MPIPELRIPPATPSPGVGPAPLSRPASEAASATHEPTSVATLDREGARRDDEAASEKATSPPARGTALGATAPPLEAPPPGSPAPSGAAAGPAPASAPSAAPKLAPLSQAFPEIARLVPAPKGARTASVEHVVDGDTIRLAGGTKVRLIGINTPERGEPLYEEATEALRALIAGRPVALVHDRDPRDQYKRDLAYVFCDGRFLNGELVRRGLAFCYRWEPNTRFAGELLELQRAARADRLGLWSLPAPAPCARYVADPESHAFHRSECSATAKLPDPPALLEWPSREAALDSGRAPCRHCRP